MMWMMTSMRMRWRCGPERDEVEDWEGDENEDEIRIWMWTRIGIRMKIRMKARMDEDESKGNDANEMRIVTSMRMR